MKKVFVMFATVAAFTLASCGGKAEQKATEEVKKEETAPVTPEVKIEDKAAEIKIDSSTKKQDAPKEGAEMKKEEAKPATEVKKEEVKK